MNRGDFGPLTSTGYRLVRKVFATAGTFYWYAPSDTQPWTAFKFRVVASPGGTSGNGNSSSVSLPSFCKSDYSSGTITATGGTIATAASGTDTPVAGATGGSASGADIAITGATGCAGTPGLTISCAVQFTGVGGTGGTTPITGIMAANGAAGSGSAGGGGGGGGGGAAEAIRTNLSPGQRVTLVVAATASGGNGPGYIDIEYWTSDTNV